jgi:hypothetical protein
VSEKQKKQSKRDSEGTFLTGLGIANKQNEPPYKRQSIEYPDNAN